MSNYVPIVKYCHWLIKPSKSIEKILYTSNIKIWTIGKWNDATKHFKQVMLVYGQLLNIIACLENDVRNTC